MTNLPDYFWSKTKTSDCLTPTPAVLTFYGLRIPFPLPSPTSPPPVPHRAAGEHVDRPGDSALGRSASQT